MSRQPSANLTHNPLISVRGVETRFGGTLVHADVSCQIFEGEIVALIGGSGSGKTVLMREMLGLSRPNSGTIELLGNDLAQLKSGEIEEIRKKCGVLFQHGALFSALTVGENIAAPIQELYSFSNSALQRLVGLRLALSGLAPEVSLRMPSELSGGMRKRAALARALALEPPLLFLDEPTSGLDPINARSFDQLILNLRDSLGVTVLLVTHDIDTLLGIADRVIVLGEGRVVAEGSIEEVKAFDDPWIQRYFNSRVAQEH